MKKINLLLQHNHTTMVLWTKEEKLEYQREYYYKNLEERRQYQEDYNRRNERIGKERGKCSICGDKLARNSIYSHVKSKHTNVKSSNKYWIRIDITKSYITLFLEYIGYKN